MSISVIVCAKNEEKYIKKCLECLKKQTIKPEIIVVDGHSKDKTYNIAKKYANKVVKDNKKGIADARNVGWKTAKGDIVAYCDADTLPPKDWIEKALNLIDDNICISGPLYPYDGDTLMKVFFKIWTNFATRFFGFFGLTYIWGPNMIFKRKIFKKYQFRVNILEDYDLVKRIRKVGKVKFCKQLCMPVSVRHLRYGFHISVLRFYARNFLRLKFGFKEKYEDYW
jgi:glycosyltransferase involved in cell wall biosynthesis